MSTRLTDETLVDKAGSGDRAAFVGTKRLKVIRQTYQPGGTHVPHHHPTTEQAYYIVSGKGRVRVADEVFEVGPNTMIYLPPKVEHEMLALGDKPLVNLLICVDLEEDEVA